MPDRPVPSAISPDPAPVQAMLAMLGIEVAADDPRLPVLVRELAGQLSFARLIDETLSGVPAEAVAGAVGTFDPAWMQDETAGGAR